LILDSIQKGESRFRSSGVENGAVIDDAFNKGIEFGDLSSPPPDSEEGLEYVKSDECSIS